MTTQTIVVTGSSRGLGRAICTLLAQRPHPLTLYATSRAGASLNLTPSNPCTRIIYSKLDTTSPSSISAFLSSLPSPADILINNAGINLDDDYNYENARKIFDVNYYGTRDMCLAFLKGGKIVRGKGRIVNVTSGACMLSTYSDDIAARFRDGNMTMDTLNGMAKEYLQVVKEGREEESGWKHTDASYSVSKACVTALTAVLARMYGDVQINCCCPGWVRTEMGSQVGEGGKTPEEGARIPLKLAVGDIGDVTGRYWANDGVENTDDGKLMEW